MESKTSKILAKLSSNQEKRVALAAFDISKLESYYKEFTKSASESNRSIDKAIDDVLDAARDLDMDGVNFENLADDALDMIAKLRTAKKNLETLGIDSKEINSMMDKLIDINTKASMEANNISARIKKITSSVSRSL